MMASTKTYLIILNLFSSLALIHVVPFPMEDVAAACWQQYSDCCARQTGICEIVSECENIRQACATPVVEAPLESTTEEVQPEPQQEPSEPAQSSNQADINVPDSSQIIIGDIPYFNMDASHHQGPEFGRTLNTNELDPIGSTLGLPSASDLVGKLKSVDGYSSPVLPPEQEIAGAYLVLSVLAKFKTMPPELFQDELQAMRAYGQLKRAGMQGDSGTIRTVLSLNGGDASGLSDDQLVQLWSGNEHQNLHAVINVRSVLFNPIHATSLNDRDEGRGGEDLGGYNDKGEYPQWGWFEDVKSFVGTLLN